MRIKKGLNSGLATIAAALIIVVVMATSFLAGMNVGHGNGSAAYVINGATVPRNLQQPLNYFWQAYQRLNADSYWRPFDPKQLFYGATSGMIDTSTLPQDSHTLFFPPADSKQANAQLNETSNGYGIGADVVMTKRGLQITNPLVDSPAQKAGLLQNDLIVAVNGRDIRKLSLTDAVDLIHGNQGTAVSLTVVRTGERQP
ncbi:MAG: S41 family peptidase, partial [Chloroflexota bacterium]